jgi:hypothetical protein
VAEGVGNRELGVWSRALRSRARAVAKGSNCSARRKSKRERASAKPFEAEGTQTEENVKDWTAAVSQSRRMRDWDGTW